MHDYEFIGWIATVLFVSSYFVKSTRKLRIIQAVSAGLWIVYGVFLSSLPVITANGLIIFSAIISIFLKKREGVSSPS